MSTPPTGIGAGMEPPGTGQSAEDGWIEHHRNVRTIVEDLQSGTIQQSFTVPGRPDEAYRNQHIGGLAIATIHPWFRHAYLVRRKFENYIGKGREQDRRTMVTATYQTRQCLNYPEYSSTASLSSVNSWWSYDDPPINIATSSAGFPILQPVSTATMRWPAIDLKLKDILRIRDMVGRVMQSSLTVAGPEEEEVYFFGELCRDMLFDGLTKKHLFGPGVREPDTISRWELSLHFRIDRLRHHQKWTVDFDENREPSEEEPNGHQGDGKPLHVASLDELFAGVGHERQTQHPAVRQGNQWDTTFGLLEAKAADGATACTSDELDQIGPLP